MIPEPAAPRAVPPTSPGWDRRALPPERPRLHRDALTGAGYGALATWAWFLYGFGPLLPLLRIEEGISRTLLGLHALALSAGALIAGSLTVPLVRRVRRRGSLQTGLALLSCGVVALCLSRSVALSLPAVLVIGTGGSLLVNGVNPSLSDHHKSASAAVLSEGNAVAAGLGLIAPLAIGAGVGLGWGWRPAVLVVLPLAAFVTLLLHRVPARTPAVDSSLERHQHEREWLPLTFWLFAGALVSGVGIEFVCTSWSADLLHQRTGLSPGSASAAVAAVVAGIAAGRLVLGRLALRIPARRLLVGALTVTAVGWLTTWLATGPALAVAGLTVTGSGIAGQYPLGMSLVLGSVPGQGDRATSRISLGIGMSSGMAPFVVGALADATSTHTAFVVVPTLIAVAVCLLLTADRRRIRDPA